MSVQSDFKSREDSRVSRFIARSTESVRFVCTSAKFCVYIWRAIRSKSARKFESWTCSRWWLLGYWFVLLGYLQNRHSTLALLKQVRYGFFERAIDLRITMLPHGTLLLRHWPKKSRYCSMRLFTTVVPSPVTVQAEGRESICSPLTWCLLKSKRYTTNNLTFVRALFVHTSRHTDLWQVELIVVAQNWTAEAHYWTSLILILLSLRFWFQDAGVGIWLYLFQVAAPHFLVLGALTQVVEALLLAVLQVPRVPTEVRGHQLVVGWLFRLAEFVATTGSATSTAVRRCDRVSLLGSLWSWRSSFYWYGWFGSRCLLCGKRCCLSSNIGSSMLSPIPKTCNS